MEVEVRRRRLKTKFNAAVVDVVSHTNDTKIACFNSIIYFEIVFKYQIRIVTQEMVSYIEQKNTTQQCELEDQKNGCLGKVQIPECSWIGQIKLSFTSLGCYRENNHLGCLGQLLILFTHAFIRLFPYTSTISGAKEEMQKCSLTKKC